MNQRGFTMVEMIVVIAIVGILAVTALPRLFARTELNQHAFADKALVTLRYARSMAIATRHYVCVTANPAATPPSLTLTVDTTNYPDAPAGFPACPVTPLALPTPDNDCGGPVNASCAQNGVTLAPAFSVVFDAAGRPSAAGVVTVTGGGNNSTITIHNETGYVSSP